MNRIQRNFAGSWSVLDGRRRIRARECEPAAQSISHWWTRPIAKTVAGLTGVLVQLKPNARNTKHPDGGSN